MDPEGGIRDPLGKSQVVTGFLIYWYGEANGSIASQDKTTKNVRTLSVGPTKMSGSTQVTMLDIGLKMEKINKKFCLLV